MLKIMFLQIFPFIRRGHGGMRSIGFRVGCNEPTCEKRVRGGTLHFRPKEEVYREIIVNLPRHVRPPVKLATRNS